MKASDLRRNLPNTTKTLLEEMISYIPKKNALDALDIRASHVIQSAISLLESFDRTCTKEEVEYLEKKLFNAIKTRDSKKFSRLLKKLKEEE